MTGTPGLEASPSPASGDSTGGVTVRAVLVSLALLVAVAVTGFYVEIAWARVSRFGAGVPAPAPAILLFLLTAVMGLPVLRRVGLSRRELLTIYSVVLVGGALVSTDVLFWMLPKTIAYYYQVQVNPGWEIFLPYIPTWFAPSDPAAVIGLFEGHRPVPWSLWSAPLAAWSSFMVSLFLGTFCLMALLQRQWVTHERLSFPLAQIPLGLVRDPDPGAGGRAARLPVTPVFWMGLAISLLVNFLSTLSTKVPALPALPIGPTPIVQWQKVGPLAGLGEIDLVLWPWLIAIAYLIPKDLSFSAWFFWVLRVGLTVVAIAAGATAARPEDFYGSEFPAPYFQGGGAVFALGLWVLWIARPHLTRGLRLSCRRGRAGRGRKLRRSG